MDAAVLDRDRLVCGIPVFNPDAPAASGTLLIPGSHFIDRAGGARRVEDSRKKLDTLTIKIDAGSVNGDPDEIHRAWRVDVLYQHLRIELREESIYIWAQRPIRVHGDHGPACVVEGDAVGNRTEARANFREGNS